VTTFRHEIPTHLNVEDKAFFGLSFRQVMFLTSGCAVSYGLWAQTLALPPPVRLVAAVTCLVFVLFLALVRPLGKPLEEWGGVTLRYLTVPKRSVWRPEVVCGERQNQADNPFSDLALAVVWARPIRRPAPESGRVRRALSVGRGGAQ
jgi:hypothetical protein